MFVIISKWFSVHDEQSKPRALSFNAFYSMACIAYLHVRVFNVGVTRAMHRRLWLTEPEFLCCGKGYRASVPTPSYLAFCNRVPR